MKKNGQYSGFFTFAVAVGAIVVLLRIVHWLPSTIEHNTLRQFGSIEEVRSALPISDIYVPSYFPQGISWPPSKILAQEKPFPAFLMEFKKTGKDEVVLILSQSRGGTLKRPSLLEPAVTREVVSYALHEKTAVLTVGECAGGEACSMITWSEGEYSLAALMRSAPFELAKIAESMHPK